MSMKRLVVCLLACVLAMAAQAQSPIDWWRFDEASGAIAYNAVSGRADGELSYGASFVGGLSGNAVALPPFESVTFWSDSGNLRDSDFTILFWLKTNGTGTISSYAEVLGNRGSDGSCDTPYFDFRMAATGRLSLEVNDWGCGGYVPASTDPAAGVVNDGAWHRIAGVRTGTSTAIYVDGQLRATGTAGDGHVAYIESLFPLQAGANDDAFIYFAPFDGMMDDLRIYDQALSPAQLVSELIDSIIALIRSYDLNPGIANSLITKLQNAQASIDAGNYNAATNQLRAFLNEVAAKSGKQLTAAEASELTTRVNAVIAALS